MISRIIVTLDPAAISQREWDDFCQGQGLSLRPTGYFAANGLHAGCQLGRVSFFSRNVDKINHLAASFLRKFGGQVSAQLGRCATDVFLVQVGA